MHLNEDRDCSIYFDEIHNMNDEELKKLIDKGYRYNHKSLEEYVKLSGKGIIASEEIDYGSPVGEEVW